MSFSSSFLTAPQLFISVYPFEGGNYFINGNNGTVLRAQVSKNIRGQVGTFALTLAPGGPNGPNNRPTWTELLTPMSLVIIGIARGQYRQIVMVGNVQSCQETQIWHTGKGVARAIVVEGTDFQQFFNQPSYYTTSFLAGSVNAVIPGAQGFKSVVSDGLLTGPPNQFAAKWYKDIMAGPNSIMANLTFAYKNSRVAFYNIVSQYWEAYDSAVTIPFADYYMLSNGSWQQKFLTTLPLPWYEFFVTTAPVGYYDSHIPPPAAAIETGGSISIPAPIGFSLPGFATVGPQVVARVNPFPWTQPTGPYTAGGTFPKVTMNQDRWNALPTFVTEETSGIEHSLNFSTDEVRNFYVINPTYLTQALGVNNSNNSPFIYTYAAFVDVGSIHRYGYRPEIAEISWFSDMSGAYARLMAATGQTPENFSQLVEELSLRQSSYFEPTPLMAKGNITMRLRPDILIGTRFIYNPFKNPEPWQFYVEGVDHDFVFGEQSTTTLTLTRGLPTTVYANSTLLEAIHTGNAQRLNGQYVQGNVPNIGSGLEPVNYASIQQGIIGQIANTFNKPQY